MAEKEVETPSDENEDVSSKEGLGDEGSEERITALEAQIEKLNAEAATQRKLKQRAIQKLEEQQSTQTNDEDKSNNWKQLYEQEKTEKQQLLDKAKNASIEAAITQQLTKVGILPDGVKAAAKLLDKDLIEWDPQNGLDEGSVEASIALLKHNYSFLFESKVNATKPKNPADGKDKSEKEITRGEFDRLPPKQKAEVAISHKIID